MRRSYVPAKSSSCWFLYIAALRASRVLLLPLTSTALLHACVCCRCCWCCAWHASLLPQGAGRQRPRCAARCVHGCGSSAVQFIIGPTLTGCKEDTTRMTAPVCVWPCLLIACWLMLGARLQLECCAVHHWANSEEFYRGHNTCHCTCVRLAMPPYGVLADAWCTVAACGLPAQCAFSNK
jgi:hypothetical protein